MRMKGSVFSRIRRSTGARARRFGTLLGVAALAVLLMACGSEEVTTIQRTPAPQQPTVTVLPPTPTPAQFSIDDLEITQDTTLRAIGLALSADEAACIRSSVGAEIYDVLQDTPIHQLPTDGSDLPMECLSLESAVGLGVAFLSSEAGGLSIETRRCIRGVGMDNPTVLGIGDTPEDPLAVLGPAFEMQLCLTDDEARALASADPSAAAPSPSQIRCLREQIGGMDSLLEILTGQRMTQDAAFELFGAAMTCGVALEG